jgi:hypothetical protein
VRTDHVQRFRRKLAGGAHRREIRRSVNHNPPGFGAAIHHFNNPLKCIILLPHVGGKTQSKAEEAVLFGKKERKNFC